MTSSAVKVPTALSNGYGKTVDELVKDAEIRADGSVYGTLLSVTGYTGFSDNPTEQKGHYFPIVLDDKYKGKTISCQRNSDAPKQSSDLEWVLRVVSNSTKFTFRADDEEILTLNFENATLA